MRAPKTSRAKRPLPRSPFPPPALAVAATLAALGAVALAGCAEERAVDEATRARVTALGDSAAMELVSTLGGRLNGALATGGPAHAIEFCAGEAGALTDSVSRALGPGWAVKRTTTRTRNPGNAPDSLETEALAYFHDADADADAEAAGGEEAPTGWVQRTPAGDYRYYMPLRIGHMCLQCHGERTELEPGVRRVLDTRYPADQATGYAEGELRGVVRVTVPRRALD